MGGLGCVGWSGRFPHYRRNQRYLNVCLRIESKCFSDRQGHTTIPYTAVWQTLQHTQTFSLFPTEHMIVCLSAKHSHSVIRGEVLRQPCCIAAPNEIKDDTTKSSITTVVISNLCFFVSCWGQSFESCNRWQTLSLETKTTLDSISVQYWQWRPGRWRPKSRINPY